jgi:glutathione synthase/RimK-type ligase-like ATP-grasp enzyme
MIYILNRKDESVTTLEIVNWLIYFQANFKNVLFSTPSTYPKQKLSSNDVFWVWKGDNNKDIRITEHNKINTYLNNENEKYFDFLIHESKQYPPLNSRSVNKLKILALAKEFNLNVPRHIVTNTKEKVKEYFKHNYNSIIVKPIMEVDFFEFEDEVYTLFTEGIDGYKFEMLPEIFSFSFFQEKIESEYEVRVFVIDDCIYSMAIFSDYSKNVDYRKTNNQGNSRKRSVPYKLNEVETMKLLKLLKKLELNTASFDLIFSNGKYYFLEVNPIGQIGMVSKSCNYFIERKIAKTLLNDTNRKTK